MKSTQLKIDGAGTQIRERTDVAKQPVLAGEVLPTASLSTTTLATIFCHPGTGIRDLVGKLGKGIHFELGGERDGKCPGRPGEGYRWLDRGRLGPRDNAAHPGHCVASESDTSSAPATAPVWQRW